MQDNFRGVTVRSFRRESSCPRRGTSLPLRRRRRTTSRRVSLSPRGRPDGSSPPFGRGMSHPYGTGAELLLRGGMFYLSSAENACKSSESVLYCLRSFERIRHTGCERLVCVREAGPERVRLLGAPPAWAWAFGREPRT